MTAVNVCPRLRQVVTPFVLEDGVLTRTVTAIEEELPPPAAALDEHDGQEIEINGATMGAGARADVLRGQAVRAGSFRGSLHINGGVPAVPRNELDERRRARAGTEKGRQAPPAGGHRDLGMRTAWRENMSNMRAVIERLRVDHPGADDDVLVDMFVERIERDPATLKAVARFVIQTAAPMREGLDRRLLQLRSAPPERQAREKVAIRTTAAAVAARILLLNRAMPNGKPMRACTGAEMAGFGAGYARVAAAVGCNNLVGDTLTEAHVKALMKTGQDQKQVQLEGRQVFPPGPASLRRLVAGKLDRQAAT